jgi:hypothetical protein
VFLAGWPLPADSFFACHNSLQKTNWVCLSAEEKGAGRSSVHFLGMIFLVFGFPVGSVWIHGVFFVPWCELKIISPQRHRGKTFSCFSASPRLCGSRQKFAKIGNSRHAARPPLAAYEKSSKKCVLR